jgi:TRAP-type C4-dicarboxylate transport system permease small subunit
VSPRDREDPTVRHGEGATARDGRGAVARALDAFDAALLHGATAVLGGGILGIAGVGIANVVARNLGGGALAFAEEVSQAFMLWITFAGLPLAARRARHIRMAAFHDALRGRARKSTWMVILSGTSALLAVLAVLAARYLVTVHDVGGVTPALRVPLWIVYAVVPVGLGLGALEYARALAHNARREGVHASIEVADEPDAAEADAP